MEVLYEDENAYNVSKQDERTLCIIMKIGGGNSTIYDIETRKYLPASIEYEFEHSLGNNLYVFREMHNSNKKFYEYKRCVINADGKVLLNDIEGWIYLSGKNLIIIKEDEISIVGINNETMLEMKTLKQNKDIIAKPAYYDDNIVIVEKGKIKIYTPNIELINEIKIDGLEEIIDYEIVADTLKICLPFEIDEEKINKHLYVNLKTGKSISHIRIEGYPYWTPTTYVGQDSIDSQIKDYHFYNADFDSIINISANSYECVDCVNECMFVTRKRNESGEERHLLNTQNGSIKQIDYAYVKFHPLLPYGYGVNLSNETIDFFDEDINVIIPNFDYKKFNLKFDNHGFDYFIVNNYICVREHFVGWDGRSRYRHIIQDSKGNIILDSIVHKCYQIGNLIQIISSDDTQFLNTITGEIGALSFNAPVDENGNINFNEINDISRILNVENNSQLLIQSSIDISIQKVKK